MPSFITQGLLVGSVIAAFVGVTSLFNGPNEPTAGSVYLEPDAGQIAVGELFTVTIMVESNVPSNVYSGQLLFNDAVLEVERIDYNNSLADIWAVEPWYSNGDGTITFAGGTTKQGGFTGIERLVQVHFLAKSVGESEMHLSSARILRHDGLGTDILVTDLPIDALFSITPNKLHEETLIETEDQAVLQVLPEQINFDLNGDGKLTLADTSIFILHLASQNLRSDFNQDGVVTINDLDLLLAANQ